MNLGGAIKLNKCGIFILTIIIVICILYFRSSSFKLPEHTTSELIDLRKLLIGSIEAAIAGGQKVTTVFKDNDFKERSKGKTKEGANDPVTHADDLSHCAMYYSLKHTFPKITIISEETSDESNCLTSHALELDPNVLKDGRELKEEFVDVNKLTVWIDPLDATQEFTERLTQYVTTMVCVAYEGVPLIGVIHEPFTGITYYGWVKKHSPKFPKIDLAGTRIITSRSHQGNVQQKAREAFGNNVDIIPAGGAGYKALQVAKGNATIYIHTTRIKKWDICAGDAILRSLRGRLSTLHDKDISYDNPDSFVNEDGVLATLLDHEKFIKKLSNVVIS